MFRLLSQKRIGLFHLSLYAPKKKLMASDLLIGVETRSFDVVFFVRYQFWFALKHNGIFDEFYHHVKFASDSKKTRQMKEVCFSLMLHCHDLTSFFVSK